MSAVGDGGRIGAYPGVRGGGGERDGREGEEEEGGTHRGRGGQANEVRQSRAACVATRCTRRTFAADRNWLHDRIVVRAASAET